MALLDEKIIVNDIAERVNNFEPIPAGKYTAMVVDSEVKPTNDKTGTILALQFEIQDGQYQNRKIFENLNIKNQNDQAQTIAREALAELCRAVGKETLSDSEELHGKRVLLNIGVRTDKPSEKYPNPEPRNFVRKYLSVNSNQQAQQATASGTADGGDATPRWKRQG